MYPAGTIDRNQLLFAVAAYNFANFMVKEFDLSFEEAGPMSMLTIHGFFNLDEILHYYKMIYGKDGYAAALDKNVAILPISDDNYETLMRGKTLEEYVGFFQENFGEAAPELAARWEARMAAEKIKEEEVKAEAEKDKQQQQAVEQPEVEPAAQDTVPKVELPVDTATVRKEEVLIPVADTVVVQPVVKDTVFPVASDTVPAVDAPVEQPKELTLKEIEALRKRESAEAEARKEEARKAFETTRWRCGGVKAFVPRASSALRRSASSASLTFTLIVRPGISISIISPSFTKPIAPPAAASGETWPIERPEVPPLKRPSVISAHSLPKWRLFI